MQKDEQPMRNENNFCESAYIKQEYMILIEFLSAVAANLERWNLRNFDLKLEQN